MIMPEKKEQPIVIELYELWNSLKARFSIVSPQPKSFTLNKVVTPVTSIDGITLDLVDLSDGTSIAAAGSDVQLLQPAKGYVYKILDIFYDAPDPAGSASGIHYLTILPNKMSASHKSMQTVADFGNAVKVDLYALSSNKTNYPSTTRDFCLIMDFLLASYDQPLKFLYNNGTDVAQAGTRTLEILVKQIPEVMM